MYQKIFRNQTEQFLPSRRGGGKDQTHRIPRFHRDNNRSQLLCDALIDEQREGDGDDLGDIKADLETKGDLENRKIEDQRVGSGKADRTAKGEPAQKGDSLRGGCEEQPERCV